MLASVLRKHKLPCRVWPPHIDRQQDQAAYLQAFQRYIRAAERNAQQDPARVSPTGASRLQLHTTKASALISLKPDLGIVEASGWHQISARSPSKTIAKSATPAEEPSWLKQAGPREESSIDLPGKDPAAYRGFAAVRGKQKVSFWLLRFLFGCVQGKLIQDHSSKVEMGRGKRNIWSVGELLVCFAFFDTSLQRLYIYL